MSVDCVATGLTLDDALDVLANEYRRRVCVALVDREPLCVDARAVADDDIAVAELNRLRTQLVHVHLPKLDAIDVVRWDRTADEVRRGSDFEEIRPLLEVLRDNADRLPGDWL